MYGRIEGGGLVQQRNSIGISDNTQGVGGVGVSDNSLFTGRNGHANLKAQNHFLL